MKNNKVIYTLTLLLILFFCQIAFAGSIPFQFRGERQSDASKRLEKIEENIKALKEKTTALTEHLEKIKNQAEKFQARLEASSSSSDFFASLPIDLRGFKEEEADKAFEFFKKNKEKLGKGINNLEGKIGNLNAAATHLSGVQSSLEELRKWDPENAAEDPTYGLSLIGSAISGKASMLPKGLRELYEFYGKAASAFAGALKRLDTTLENARQSSVCAKRGSRSMRSVAEFIATKASVYNCADCRVLGAWSTFPSYMLTQCSEGEANGYIFYNGQSGRGYHISGEGEVDMIHSWMQEGDIPKEKHTFKSLNKYAKDYRKRKADIEKDRQKITEHRNDLNEFYKCGMLDSTERLKDLADEGPLLFLKYALINTDKYNASRGVMFGEGIDKYYLLTGIVTARDKGEKVGLNGVSVRITDGISGPRIGSTSTSTDQKFCIKVVKKKLTGTPYVEATRGEYSGGSELNFKPGDSHQYSGVAISRLSEEVEEIIEETNEMALACSHIPCDLCQEPGAESCIDCQDKACTALCAKSSKCLPCKDILCSECESENTNGCIADENPPKDTAGEDGGERTAGIWKGARCHDALDSAKALAPLYKLRRQEFRSVFDSENGSLDCASNKAAYYFVEMKRLYGEYSAALGVVENITDPMSTEQVRSDEEISSCFDRYEKAKNGKQIMEKNISYAERKFRENDCDQRQVENVGSTYPPGMSSAEVEVKVGSTSGTWKSSAGGVPFCITNRYVTQVVEALTTALSPLTTLGLTVNVSHTGNTVTGTASFTTPPADCRVTVSIKFVLTLQASTGTQTFTLSYLQSGDCSASPIPSNFSQTTTLTKISNSCTL